MTHLLATAILIVFSFSLSAQTVHNLNNSGVFSLRNTENFAPPEFLEAAKAARTFALNPVLQSATSVGKGDIVLLQLFENQSYSATISSITTDVNGTAALTLKLPDYPMGFAIIATDAEGKSLVTVSIPELELGFGTRYDVASGQHYLLEIAQGEVEIPGCGNDAVIIPEEMKVAGDQPPQPGTVCVPETKDVDAPATIDVMIVFSAAAANYASASGGTDVVASRIIAYGNLCLENSQTGITLTLAHSAQVDYKESNMNDALVYLTTTNDGYMDEVHALRQQYKADLVQLLTTESNYGGLGYVLKNETIGNYDFAFSVVNIGSAVSDNSPATIHELGHNMGLGHGANQSSATSTGIYPYSQGWDWTETTNNQKYCSLMSYPDGAYYSDNISRNRVPYFSNPKISYLEVATGDAERADAARSLREMKHVVAYYSDRMQNLLDAPTNVTVSNPTRTGGTVTWDAVPGATSYKLSFFLDGSWWSYSNIPNNSFRLNNATYFQPCKQYKIFVAAANDCGDHSSASQHITFNTVCSLTITFDAQGGGVNPTTQTVTPGSAVGDLPIPTRSGYTFGGWFTEINGGGTEYTSKTVCNNHVEDFTLYAKWTAIVNTYTLTFDPQGGTVNPTTKSVTYDAAVGDLPTPTRSGYTFGGWFTEINGGGTEYTSKTVYNNTEDLTLYANWIVNTYTLTFDAQNGTVNPTTQSVTYDAAVGDLPTPTRSGYTFGGWFTEINGGGTEYTSATIYNNVEDITLYAKWTAVINTYTLIFDPQGGTVNPTTKSVTDDAAVGDLPTPTRSGYTFAGWFTQVNGEGSRYTASTVYNNAEDLTLYANWTPNTYTLTFDAQGGTVSPTSRTVTFGSVLETLPTPRRNGYTFGGWFTEVNGEGTRYTASTVYNTAGDLTLYAKWTAIPVYTITASAGSGGSISPAGNVSVTQGSNQTFDFHPNTGYEIDKITVDGANIPVAGSYSFTDVTANHTIRVVFKAKQYTLTFDAQGGTVSPTTHTVTYNSPVGTLPTPTRANYTSNGWFTAANGGGTQYTSATIHDKAGNVTLYAKWTPTVSNEAVAENAIWGTSGVLHVKATVPGAVSVYSITGRLIILQNVVGAKTFTLPKGIYIVKLNGVTTKVFL
ncbi:MAG: InlB B-repeat-containing protein [Tannerella sp.]|nr:InlB B-repeat-containing protein [Tannerella sp.]